ncbi:MlaD family protein [Mycobacteroides abscessus]|uniref:MlaD family protein n=1 Tax=Mycobacteroides abscessus TaxID=36809 RepID=UPI003F682489
MIRLLQVQFIAESIVLAARSAHRTRHVLSGIALVVTLFLSAGYLGYGALGRKSPWRQSFSVQVMLRESGGLLPDQDVTLRGQTVGRVRSVTFNDAGVVAVAEIDPDTRIPADSQVKVSALSPAGEQHLEFRPTQAPAQTSQMLKNGSTVVVSQTQVPVSLTQLLDDADGVLSQLDAGQLTAITSELRVGRDGARKLADILDGGMFLISTLDSVLPETINLVRNHKTVLASLAPSSEGLQSTAANLASTLHGAGRMDNGFRALLNTTGPTTLKEFDQIIHDNSDAMVQLLGNLTTVAPLLHLRLPALNALFPNSRGSLLDAVDSIVHDGAVWAIADIYPRYSCDYNLPRRPPSIPDFPEPYRYTYCNNSDPAVLVRGARNAPRPSGDDTAGPPAEHDPLAQTDPTPVGSYSIPATYGGPALPVDPPR